VGKRQYIEIHSHFHEIYITFISECVNASHIRKYNDSLRRTCEKAPIVVKYPKDKERMK